MRNTTIEVLCLGVLCVGVFCVGGWLPASAQTPPSSAAPGAERTLTVALVVDYGDGMQKRYSSLAWHEGMTVQDALQLAEQHPRGIRWTSRGKRATALLLSIDELNNGAAPGKNWIYRVNGKLGDRSFAVFPLQSGDLVEWKFDRYEDAPAN